MRYHFLFFLALISKAEATDTDPTAPSIETQIAQSPERHPPNLNPYLRALREIYSLQQINAELKDQIIALQFHSKQADILQQHVVDLEQELAAVNKQNQDLQEQIGVLTKAQAEDASKLQQCNNLLKQFEEQKQTFEQEQKQNREELQENTQQRQSFEQEKNQNRQELLENIRQLQASFEKWSQENDLLKSKLDKANVLNSELSRQITQLEEECKKR